MCGQVSFTCLLRPSFLPNCGGFSGSRKSEQRPALQSTEQGLAGHFFLLVLLCCCCCSGTFLSFWPFTSSSIYCRKAFRGVLCFAQKVFISRKLQVSTLEDWQGAGAHAYCSYIPDSFNSARLHRGNILLPILGSAWPGSQLQHSNMLKSKMHKP